MNSQDDFSRPTSYANFGQRLVAYLIDGLLLSLVAWLILFAFGGAFLATATGTGAFEPGAEPNPEMMAGFMGAYFLFVFGIIVMQWLYFAILESSEKQATLGKRAMRLVVTDVDGGRISFGRATGRYFGRILSGMIFMVGYIMQPFTEKKQALHDMIASTLVLKVED